MTANFSARLLRWAKTDHNLLHVTNAMGPLNSPVDKIPGLQVGHARGNLSGHVHESCGANLLPVASPQVVQQVAVGHEFRHDVEWRLTGAHTCHTHRFTA